MVSDIVLIIIAIVLFQNMGLREAIEKVVHYKFKIFSCTRCSVFWIMIVFFTIHKVGIIETISLAFISAYAAVWCELLFGFLTYLYNVIYKKFCNFADE